MDTRDLIRIALDNGGGKGYRYLELHERLEYQRRCLLWTPPEDINFKSALQAATLPMLEDVLGSLPAAGNKTRRQIIAPKGHPLGPLWGRKLQKQAHGANGTD